MHYTTAIDWPLAKRHSLQCRSQWISEFTVCGQSGLLQSRLLLTQHSLAIAADLMLRYSPSRGSGHSVIPTSVEFRPTLRFNLYELTEGGRSGLMQLQLLLTQHFFAIAA